VPENNNPNQHPKIILTCDMIDEGKTVLVIKNRK